MQNQEREFQQKEMASKLWSKDVASLTTNEVMDLVNNIFYQMFLIQVTAVNYAIKTDESGTFVKFVIDGEAYLDEKSIDTSDKLDAIAEEEELDSLEE